jgi:N-acyl-L-homoserine lactone synthetase
MAKTAKIKVVHPVERWAFSKPLMEMHHHRKQVFVDRLRWQLASPGSWLEIDEFDNEYAVYVMAVGAQDGRHLGSVRLLPTTRPHMLSSIFADLCPEGAPAGEDVWEISRLVAAPEARGTSLLRVYRQLAEALIDFARQNGIARYTLVTEAHRVSALLAVGWTVNPLSLPTERDGEMIEALEIVVDEESLHRVRERGRWSGVQAPAAPQVMTLA